MSQGRCKTCKHWASSDDIERPDEIEGACGIMGTHISEGKRLVDDMDTLAFAESMEPAAAQLRTHPYFGCVMWETWPTD